MTVEARVNLQKGVPEDKRFPATDYTSDGSLMDNYLLMSVNARKQILDRYNAQEAEKQRKRAEAQEQKKMEAEIEKLRLRSNNSSRESKVPERDVVELDRDSEAEKIQDMFQQIDEEKKHKIDGERYKAYTKGRMEQQN